MGDSFSYFKYPRFFKKDPLFRTPLTWHLFVYYLTEAAWEEREIVYGTRIIVIEPGEFVISRSQASRETGLSEQQVRTANEKLIAFRKIENIKGKSTNKFSVFCIVGWADLQNTRFRNNQRETGKKPAKAVFSNSRSTSREEENNALKTGVSPQSQNDSNQQNGQEKEKNSENSNQERSFEKEDNNMNKNRKKIYIEEAKSLAYLLKDSILKINPTAKITDNDLAEWVNTVLLMIERDGRSTEDIKEHINAAFEHPRWWKYIHNMSGLRKQYDKISAEIISQQNIVRDDDSWKKQTDEGEL